MRMESGNVWRWNNRIVNGILLTFCFCFGVVDDSQVDEADDINDSSVQLWMAVNENVGRWNNRVGNAIFLTFSFLLWCR